jgi:hypothetical protein
VEEVPRVWERWAWNWVSQRRGKRRTEKAHLDGGEVVRL